MLLVDLKLGYLLKHHLLLTKRHGKVSRLRHHLVEDILSMSSLFSGSGQSTDSIRIGVSASHWLACLKGTKTTIHSISTDSLANARTLRGSLHLAFSLERLYFVFVRCRVLLKQDLLMRLNLDALRSHTRLLTVAGWQ